MDAIESEQLIYRIQYSKAFRSVCPLRPTRNQTIINFEISQPLLVPTLSSVDGGTSKTFKDKFKYVHKFQSWSD